jgi:hypothetical protein
MDETTKQEREPQVREPEGAPIKGIQAGDWKVTDEEIDRVIKKLEEGWQF